MIEINNIDDVNKVLNKFNWWDKRDVMVLVATDLLEHFEQNNSDDVFFAISRQTLVNSFQHNINFFEMKYRNKF